MSSSSSSSISTAPLFVKTTTSQPSREEEASSGFFQFPVEKQSRFDVYTQASLGDKFGGIEHLSQEILREIDLGHKIHSTFEIIEPSQPAKYAPTIGFMEKLAEHHANKYGIAIKLVSKENAAEEIRKMVANKEGPSVGLVIYSAHSFHVTPVLIYKGDPDGQCYVMVMDCLHRKKISHVLVDLEGNMPENTEILFGDKVRLGGRFYCRAEAMVLLKNALYWAKANPNKHLADYFTITAHEGKKSHKTISLFPVPRQWSVGANLSRSVVENPRLKDDVINHKGETYFQWYQRHPDRTITVHVSAESDEQTGFCERMMQKESNFFLVDKVDKWREKYAMIMEMNQG